MPSYHVYEKRYDPRIRLRHHGRVSSFFVATRRIAGNSAIPSIPTYVRSGFRVTSATAFSPCNITGFFRIHSDLSDPPLRAGSTGASVAIKKGVTTLVRVKKARKSTIYASFNNRPLRRNSVSFSVAKKFIELEGSTWSFRIDHHSPLPTGCGYGTSGAGALGLSFALNEAMGLSLSRVEAAQLAHISEIGCKTGLGTVTSVFSGGFALRTAPGAPGVGKIIKIPFPRTLRLVTTTFGPISTSRVLGSVLLKNRINTCGRGLTDRLDLRHLQSSFMDLSRRFSDCLSLMSHRLNRLTDRLDSAGFKSSMVMLGESAFCIAAREDVKRIAAIIESAGPTAIVSAISGSGASLI